MKQFKHKFKAILIALPLLTGCEYLRDHQDDLQAVEKAVETEFEVGLKATAPKKPAEPTLKDYQDAFKKNQK